MVKFTGRVINPGVLEGIALVSRQGFNTLASFYPDVINNAPKATCWDKNNPDLYGQILTDKILCIPETIGSTSAGSTWEIIIRKGLHPRAILLSKKIDSLLASGLAIAEIWSCIRVITIDKLGKNFLERIKNGDRVKINHNGTIFLNN